MSKPITAAARIPQRERGKLRVASLLEAAASVFAEKGYAATTMTEIAARADAPIGSLYQFFPNKEALADALLMRYAEQVKAALDAIEARAATLASATLADALLGVLIDLRSEREAALALIDVRRDAAEGPATTMRGEMRRSLIRIVRAHLPALTAAAHERIATLLQYLMKTTVSIYVAEGGARSAALGEMRALARDYLTSRAEPRD